MPKKQDDIQQELDSFLRSLNLVPTAFYATGKNAPDPSEADFFQVKLMLGGHDYGTVTIALEDGKILLFTDKKSQSSETHDSLPYVNFIKSFKDWAMLHGGQRQLKIDTLNNLNPFRQRRIHQDKRNKLAEGYYGTSVTSYNDTKPGKIKMIIKHNRSLREGDQRFRYIEKIFLETDQGERLLLNTVRPSRARMYAMHLIEGGEYNDQRWKHLTELCEDADRLYGFVRATKNENYDQDAQHIVESVSQHYRELKETLKRLQSARGYNQYFENWKPTLAENESIDISDIFINRNLDPRIANAMPAIAKIRLSAAPVKETMQFENWADKVIESISADEMSNAKELAEIIKQDEHVGPGASNIIALIQDIIPQQHKDELMNQLIELAEIDADSDASPAIVLWLQQHANNENEYYAKALSEIDTDTTIPAKSKTPPVAPKKQSTKSDKTAQKPATPATPPLPEPLAEQEFAYLQRMLKATK